MLTDTTIKNAKPKDKPYRMADEKALYLEVMPNGSKYFRMKYRIDGKEKRLAFGGKRYRKSNTPNLKSLGCSLRRAGRKQPMIEYEELQGQGGEIRGGNSGMISCFPLLANTLGHDGIKLHG